MTRMRLRRAPVRSHWTRNTLIALGATIGAAEGLRRWRHRHHEEPGAEQIET